MGFNSGFKGLSDLTSKVIADMNIPVSYVL